MNFNNVEGIVFCVRRVVNSDPRNGQSKIAKTVETIDKKIENDVSTEKEAYEDDVVYSGFHLFFSIYRTMLMCKCLRVNRYEDRGS